MTTFAQKVADGKEITSIQDLFEACYYFYPISARWNWEEVLDMVLEEAKSEKKITDEQAEQVRLAVLDCYMELLDEEREERWKAMA